MIKDQYRVKNKILRKLKEIEQTMEIRILQIRMHGQHPPVNFTELTDACVKDNNIKNKILEIVKLKSRSKESDQNPVDSILIKYAYERLSLIKH